MRDVTVGQVAEAVVTIDYFYEEGDAGKFPPIVRDVEVRNVTAKKSPVRPVAARLRTRSDQ